MSAKYTDEELADFLTTKGLLLVGLAAAPALLAAAVVTGSKWCLQHHVLVPSKDAMVTIPHTAAGLDLLRIAVLVLVLGAASAVAFHVLQHVRRRRRAARQLLRELERGL